LCQWHGGFAFSDQGCNVIVLVYKLQVRQYFDEEGKVYREQGEIEIPSVMDVWISGELLSSVVSLWNFIKEGIQQIKSQYWTNLEMVEYVIDPKSGWNFDPTRDQVPECKEYPVEQLVKKANSDKFLSFNIHELIPDCLPILPSNTKLSLNGSELTVKVYDQFGNLRLLLSLFLILIFLKEIYPDGTNFIFVL